MLKFTTWCALNEDDSASVDAIFTRLQADIENWFTQLGRAAQVSFGNKGRVRQEVIDALRAALSKLTTNESHDHTVSEIEAMFDEADSAVSGVSPQNVNSASGRQRFRMSDVLNNIKAKILDRVNQIHRVVTGGQFSKIDSRLSGLRNRSSEISNRVKGLGGQVDDIHGAVTNPAMPFSPEEEDAAEDSMIAIQQLHPRLRGNLKIKTRSGQEIKVSPHSDEWKRDVLRAGDKRFVISTQLPGEGGLGQDHEEPVNMGNYQDVERVLAKIKRMHKVSDRNPDVRPTPDQTEKMHLARTTKAGREAMTKLGDGDTKLNSGS